MLFGIDIDSTRTNAGIWQNGTALLMPTIYRKSKNFYIPPNRRFFDWPYLQEQMVAEFAELKSQAQQYFGREIDKTVLSAPSYYSPVYYNVIRDAGSTARLDIIWILRQLSAASLSYAYDHKDAMSDRALFIVKLDKHVLEICASLFGVGICEILGYANSRLVGEKKANLVSFLKDFLKSLSISESDIEEVLFLGEESDIPYLREVVAEVYNCQSKLSIIPDTASVRGSMLQSAMLQAEMKGILLFDTTSESYGIELDNDRYLKLICKNVTVPAKKAALIQLDSEKLRSRITILSGENERASENRLIGAISLSELTAGSYKNATK